MGILRMDFLCFQKCSQEIFSPTLPFYLQGIYIKDSFLAFEILYSYDASKAVQE